MVVKLCPNRSFRSRAIKEPRVQVLCLRGWQNANAFCALLLLVDNFRLIDINYETNDITAWVKRYHVPGFDKKPTGHERKDPSCGFSRNIYRPFRWLWKYIDRSYLGINNQGRREHQDQYQSLLRGLVTSNPVQYDGIRILCQHLRHFSSPFFVTAQEVHNYDRTPLFQPRHPPPERDLQTYDWLPPDCQDYRPRCCKGQLCKHVTHQGIGFLHIDPILEKAVTCYGCHGLCHRKCTEELDYDHPYCTKCVNIILYN